MRRGSMTLRYLVSFAPAGLVGLSLVCLYFYPITKSAAALNRLRLQSAGQQPRDGAADSTPATAPADGPSDALAAAAVTEDEQQPLLLAATRASRD